jgi:hypothetical protein
MRDRFRWLRRIDQLDPVRDHQEIYRISAGFEFPWDYHRALDLALFRTYCVPSISALLEDTGEFRDRPQKRYDDTMLLMGELAEHGYDSPRGREALRVVNRQHGRYPISQEDLRYVLSTFVYEPVDWLDRFGWRPLSEREKLAAFHFYREVGARMGIRDIPTDYEAFRRFKGDYEAAAFRYADSNRAIGRYTLGLLTSWYPRPVRPAVDLAVRGLLEPAVLAAFGLEPAPPWVSAAERAGLRTRARAVRALMPPRSRSRLAADPRNRTYPGYPVGYRPADLGARARPDAR